MQTWNAERKRQKMFMLKFYVLSKSEVTIQIRYVHTKYMWMKSGTSSVTYRNNKIVCVHIHVPVFAIISLVQGSLRKHRPAPSDFTNCIDTILHGT